jgi:hypothetical protein
VQAFSSNPEPFQAVVEVGVWDEICNGAGI